MRERKDIKCARCDSIFNTVQDHGRWPKYCGRACFEAGYTKPVEKNCLTCGNKFMAAKSRHKTTDGMRDYCSNVCRANRPKTWVMSNCKNCGTQVYRTESSIKIGKYLCCSEQCQREYYRLDKSHAWNGGTFISESRGELFAVVPGQKRAKTYRGVHRVIVESHIGRPLIRDEIVIRLNRVPSDNRIENLYVVRTNREFSKMRQGSLPWPHKSNLNTYK